jgi:hypothetical protein
MYNSYKIHVINQEESEQVTLSASLSKYLQVTSPQTFYPIFQAMSLEELLPADDNMPISNAMYRNAIFESKYRCSEILGIVDTITDKVALPTNFETIYTYNDPIPTEFVVGDMCDDMGELPSYLSNMLLGQESDAESDAESDDSQSGGDSESHKSPTSPTSVIEEIDTGDSSDGAPILSRGENIDKTSSRYLQEYNDATSSGASDVSESDDEMGENMAHIYDPSVELDKFEYKLREPPLDPPAEPGGVVVTNMRRLYNNEHVICKVATSNGDEHIGKLFIKKSALLEPLKIVKGMYSLSTEGMRLPDIIAINTMTKLNNVNNSAHVEALFLYLGNKLVEEGRTVAFPYYYGCINALDPNYYFNISDIYGDLEQVGWFQERLRATNTSLILTDNSGNIRAMHATSNIRRAEYEETGGRKASAAAYEELRNPDKLIDVINLDDIDLDTASLSQLKKNAHPSEHAFLHIRNMPVNMIIMEHMNETLDDMMDGGYIFTELEWQAIIFQVGYGLAVANKYFAFVHNDLHASNIMVQRTTEPYMYYKIGAVLYRIPTFGRIYKIIDFARATFKLNDRWIYSDVFQDGNDASCQYDYVPLDGYIPENAMMPNPSFDLVRFAISVFDRLAYVPVIKDFLTFIATDDTGSMTFCNNDSFQLYIDIAHNCHNAVPIQVIQSNFFDRFIITDPPASDPPASDPPASALPASALPASAPPASDLPASASSVSHIHIFKY